MKRVAAEVACQLNPPSVLRGQQEMLGSPRARERERLEIQREEEGERKGMSEQRE
jgi:hypothetical protein